MCCLYVLANDQEHAPGGPATRQQDSTHYTHIMRYPNNASDGWLFPCISGVFRPTFDLL